MYKKDIVLGERIHQLLINNQAENPTDFKKISQWKDKHYLRELHHVFSNFLCTLGYNIDELELNNTAKRIVEDFLQERFYGQGKRVELDQLIK